MSEVTRSIDDCISSFADDIGALLRQAVLESVATALMRGDGPLGVATDRFAAGSTGPAGPTGAVAHGSGSGAGAFTGFHAGAGWTQNGDADVLPLFAATGVQEEPAPISGIAPRRGSKRTSAEIEATAEALATFILEHPGLRIEEISRALGVTSRDLQLPVRKLSSLGRLRTEGQKRATRYYAA